MTRPSEKVPPLVIPANGPLDAAIECLRSSGVVAFPTETLYGLAADALNARAVNAVYALKGRAFTEPLPIIIGDIAMLAPLVTGISDTARKLMERYWPGPLTIIFDAGATLPPVLTGGGKGVGVRLSSSRAARALSLGMGGPITATSANPSGMPSATTADEVLNYFDGRIGVIMDGGALAKSPGSTVVDARGNGVRVIRRGELEIDPC